MDNIFDKSLHYLGKNQKEVFVMNIGAMDGVLFDEMFGYTNMYNFNGLYVEPIPYLFERLKNNIKIGLFENSAISEYNGEIEMMTIKRDAIDNKLVHDCFYGMSAVYPPKNGLGSEFDKPTVEKYGEIVKVNCITYETLLEKHNVKNIDVIKIDAEGHDYKIFKQINLKNNNLKVIRIEWINLTQEEQNLIIDTFNKSGFKYEISGQDIIGITNELYDILLNDLKDQQVKSNVTIVTGLWDIKRDELSTGWNRSYQHYLDNLEKLMKTDDNMIIFIEEKYKDFVDLRRKKYNTLIVVRESEWFKSNNDIFNKIQKIRTSPDWYEQVGWLKDSTQAKLEMYNPLVMSKMFLLNDAVILDPFNSSHLVWIDGGITNTVHEGYFWKDKVINKLSLYFDKFSFVCFPYEGKEEIHGFKYDKICRYSENDVTRVARGGIFGGPKNTISEINGIYYNLLVETLSNDLMGTEESIFTIMTYKYPQLINFYEIESNGLLNLFFENLKNDNLINKQYLNIKLESNNVGLYVITYNSPSQFEKLCLTFEQYDSNFLIKTKKYLLNNSLDKSTFDEYDRLCELYGFEEIHKDNIGICGGRQFIAEHFDTTGLDYYLFFEDDMFFYLKKGEVCRNGFNRYFDDFFNKTIEIMSNENFDFLKLNYSEFYGDNGTQWSWYNVPQSVREEHWPNNKKLPQIGLDPNAPKTIFEKIVSHKGIPYASGEIYYCNWPQIVSKSGNKKMFLETKWNFPYEQTWMSHIYQETKKGKIKPGLILGTPTEHDRFDFYPKEERREN